MRVTMRAAVLAVAVGLVAGVAIGADDAAMQLKGRLDEVLAGKRPLAEVRIDAVWSGQGHTSLTVFGNGVGIVNRERQFQVAPAEQRTLLKLFTRHGFFEMPEKPKPPAAARPVNGPAIMRAVSLTIGDLSKSVLQTDKVNTLPALETLVEALFAGCDKAARKGRTAASLAEGLDLVARGKLAPEVLSMVVSQPAQASDADAQEGFVITIDGAVMTHTPQRVGTLTAVPRRRLVTPEEVREVASVLRDGGWAKLPNNVFRPRYVDVSVTILRHSRVVQARRFAGMDAAAQSPERALIEKTITILERMATTDAVEKKGR